MFLSMYVTLVLLVHMGELVYINSDSDEEVIIYK